MLLHRNNGHFVHVQAGHDKRQESRVPSCCGTRSKAYSCASQRMNSIITGRSRKVLKAAFHWTGCTKESPWIDWQSLVSKPGMGLPAPSSRRTRSWPTADALTVILLPDRITGGVRSVPPSEPASRETYRSRGIFTSPICRPSQRSIL